MRKATANNCQPKNLPELLTTEQAAVLLGVSKATVRRMAVSGSLPARKVGKKLWRFPKRAIFEELGILPGS